MKKALRIIVAALLSVSVMPMLFGCPSDGTTSPSAVREIMTTKATAGNVAITNYQVVYNYSPSEYRALSVTEMENLAKTGYDQAVEKIKADGVSNFTIYGMTASDPNLESNSKSQMMFMLDHETSELVIYGDTDSDGRNIEVGRVSVTYPLG
jgi:hypothetical protein